MPYLISPYTLKFCRYGGSTHTQLSWTELGSFQYDTDENVWCEYGDGDEEIQYSFLNGEKISENFGKQYHVSLLCL